MQILRPRGPGRAESRVLGSRFLAEAAPVADESAARLRRAGLAAEFPDATHHCWALLVGAGDGTRALLDDAGEPAGTAGAPILQAIRSAGVIEAQVVVVRWFGGTKLGRGGLRRAYRDAARAALAAAGAETVETRAALRLRGPIGGDGEVRHLLARHGGAVRRAGYDAAGSAILDVDLPEGSAAPFVEALGRLSRGAWRAASAAARDPDNSGG
ncbi:MAG TPA: YigZ family protein [Dongiaceae bacterium]|nr:YigZ family protein [Dongiaceae bacterium]